MSSKNIFQDNLYREICSEKTLQSNSQGFFLTFADFVAEETGEEWIKNVFGKLKSDAERIKCVYESKETKDLLETFLSNVQEVYRPKNAEFSQKKRLEAERLLKRNEIQNAALIYCQSVLRAPKSGNNSKIDSGLSLALALWGRSQAYLKLQRFRDALTDVQQALKENLPGSYKAQAFWNMGISYRGLGEENRAKVSFDLAEKLLQNDGNKIKMLNEDRTRDFNRDTKSNNAILVKPYIQGDPNKSLPNASTKLSVKNSKEQGRYVVANQNIATGETLIVDSPYASALLPEMFGTNCHHCFKSLETSFGCPDCSSIAFCSIECRDQAVSTYHKYECKFLDLLIGSGMSILAHTALRMITQNGLEKSLEPYENRDKEKIYQLCTNAHLRSAGDFLQRTLMAAFLLRCLQKSNFFGHETKQVTPSEDEYIIGEMLLFNLQMLQFNAHEIFETKHTEDSKMKGTKTLYIAVAVYLTASLLNHDCFPALSRHFVGRNIVLTSVRPLKKNEMVPENYGPIFTRTTLTDRQRSLSSRYWFKCQCMACCQDWPQIDRGLEKVSQRIRCTTENCPNCFTLPMTNQSVRCPKCTKTIDLSKRINLLKWIEEQKNLGFDLINKGDIKKAIKVLSEAIDTFYKISLPPNQEIHLTEQMLQVCMSDSGNKTKKIQ